MDPVLMRISAFKILIVATIVAIASGCATKYRNAEPPDIRVAGLKMLRSSNLLEQQFELDLAIGNPNNFGFTIDGLRYVLYLNGRKFATGYSRQRVTVGRLSEARITTIGRTDLAKLVRQFLALPEAQGLDYRITGDVFLSDFPKKSMSFEKAGDIRLTTP